MPNSNRIFLPGNRFLVAFLAFLGAFPPLTTDMYLPALPVMAETMHTSNELISFTLSGHMFTFALVMLLWGPLSDRYGRLPILRYGVVIYIVSSIALALSGSITTLIIWRIIQAVGSGAATTISLAVVKDVVRGPRMEKIVALMQAAIILAPIVAPAIGGGLMLFLSWRGIFWCLTLCGLLALGGSFLLRETARKPQQGSDGISLASIGKVLKQKKFVFTLILFSFMAMPFMSYLGASSFIFQDYFKVSPQEFSLFFSFNACVSLLGPLCHMAVFRHWRRNMVLGVELLVMALAGATLLVAGYWGPWTFALIFSVQTFAGSCMRAPSTVLMMESAHGHNGLVASLINCLGTLCGAFAMSLATFSFWPNPIMAVAVIAVAVSGCGFLAWLFVSRWHRAEAARQGG